MNDVCRAFAGTQLPPAVDAVAQVPVPKDLREVAQAFVDLQEARHEADYDLGHRFTRSETQALADQAERAFAAWQRVRGLSIAMVFLTSLLLWNNWRR
jgi:hypothetical protein